MDDPGIHISRQMTVRYAAVLAVIGGLAIALFLGLVRFINEASNASAFLSMAGRQRTLVEQAGLSLSRLILLPATQGAEQGALQGDFVNALNVLDSSHYGLLAGLPELRSPSPPSEAVRAIYFGPVGQVDQRLRDFIAHGRVIASRFPARPVLADPDVSALLHATSGELIHELDLLIERHQQENHQHLVQLSALQGGAMMAILALLVLSAGVVFRPMVRRIRDDIGERHKVESRLRESEERLWKILEESPIGVSVSKRSNGRVIFVNKRFCDIVGIDSSVILGQSAGQLFASDDQRRRAVEMLKQAGRISDREVLFRRADGTPFWSLLTLAGAKLDNEDVNLAWVYDISALKGAEKQLRLTAKVVESASEAVVITNLNNEIEFVNPAFTTITEYTAEDVLGKSPSILSSGRHDEDFYRSMWETLDETGRWRGEIWNRRKSGEFYAEWLSIVALKDENDQVSHHIAIFSDITHRKEDEERIWRQANYDVLTGLPNRSLFADRLEQEIHKSRRENRVFGVLFIDLDGFKAVNDTLGHAAGDLLLQQTAMRLQECMRASDTVARMAGDEFTCILTSIRHREDAAFVAAKILEKISQPYDLDGRPAQVRASIGIAIYPEHAQDSAELMVAADKAMYRIKRRGKNNFCFVDSIGE